MGSRVAPAVAGCSLGQSLWPWRPWCHWTQIEERSKQTKWQLQSPMSAFAQRFVSPTESGGRKPSASQRVEDLLKRDCLAWLVVYTSATRLQLIWTVSLLHWNVSAHCTRAIVETDAWRSIQIDGWSCHRALVHQLTSSSQGKSVQRYQTGVISWSKPNNSVTGHELKRMVQSCDINWSRHWRLAVLCSSQLAWSLETCSCSLPWEQTTVLSLPERQLRKNWVPWLNRIRGNDFTSSLLNIAVTSIWLICSTSSPHWNITADCSKSPLRMKDTWRRLFNPMVYAHHRALSVSWLLFLSDEESDQRCLSVSEQAPKPPAQAVLPAAQKQVHLQMSQVWGPGFLVDDCFKP